MPGMSRSARGLVGGALVGVAVLWAAALALPIQWIAAFFATTTVLTLIALGIEMWRASRALERAEATVRH